MQTKRQTELVEAAIQLTAKSGIQKLTIRNVASAIGVSEAAVYRHFDSKHALLQAILAHLDTLLTPQFSTLQSREGSYKEALGRFIGNLFLLLERNAAFTVLLFAEETFTVDIHLRPQLDTLLSGNLKQLADFYEKAMENGSCRTDLPAYQLAVITFGTLRLSVSRWHLQEHSGALSEQAAMIHTSLSTLFALK